MLEDDEVKTPPRDLFEYITSVENSEYSADRGGMRGKFNAFKRSYIGNRNPAAVRTTIRPRQYASSDNDYVANLLKDPEYYDLMDEMYDKDGIIKGTEDLMVSQICGKDMILLLDDESDEKQRESKAFIEEHLFGLKGLFGFKQACQNIIRYALRHGLSVSEKIYERRGGNIVYKSIVHRHPAQFEIGQMGELYLYEGSLSRGSGLGRKLRPEKFILTTTAGPYGSPYGESILYPLRWAYYIKKNAINAWGDSVEISGTPITVAKVGASVSDKAKTKSDLETALANIRRNNAILLPEGVSFETFERGIKSGTLPHKELISYFDKVIVRSMMGSTLSSTENEGTGSLSQSVVHNKIADDVQIPLIEILQDAIQGLIDEIHTMNFGGEIPAPKLHIDIDGEPTLADLEKRYNIANSIGLTVSRKQAYKDLQINPPVDSQDELDLNESLLDSTTGRKKEGSKSKVAAGLEAPSFSDDKPPVKFMSRSEIQRLGKEYDEFLFAVSDALAEEAVDEVLDVIREGLARLSREYPEADIVTADILSEFAFPSSYSVAAPSAVAGTRAYAAMRFIDLAKESISIPRGVDIDSINPMYKDGIEWLQSRGLATVDEVSDMADAVSFINRNMADDVVERSLRSQFLALQGAPSKHMASKYMGLISSAVSKGETISDFRQSIQALVDSGEVPPALRSYIDNVFRTEVSMVYNAQRETMVRDPELSDSVWGKEFYNPVDYRSRDSHAKMDGIRVKMGSQAEIASRGGPPWSYQCRCGWVPVLKGDPDAVEPSDALSLAMGIERFSSNEEPVILSEGPVDMVRKFFGMGTYDVCDFDEYGMYHTRIKGEATILPRGNGRFDIECDTAGGMARVLVSDDGVEFISNTIGAEMTNKGVVFNAKGPIILRNYGNGSVLIRKD